LIFISIFLYKNYSLEKKYQEKYSTRNSKFLVSPTPTVYKCPVIDEKIKVYDGVEKILLPCQLFDDNYCQISNKETNKPWMIKYPKKWNLYRIKRIDSSQDRVINYYDLKFEYKDSYFYLREYGTLGGQPVILKDNEWLTIRDYCFENIFNDDKSGNNIILCYGNLIGCAGNIQGDIKNKYSINKHLKSLLTINTELQEGDVLIYSWYIPALKFGRREPIDGILSLRVYALSLNFYSNDQEFIDEIKRIYIDLVKKF
jgi:hypothetical protein